MKLLKYTKKLLCGVFALLLILNIGALAFAADTPKIPAPTKEFYCNDFANVLDSSTESKIVSLGESISKNTDGGQVVFVSVASIGDSTIEEYANELFNKWGIGKDDKGILFIISMEERYSRIEVGYGYEGVLTDLESYNLLQKFSEVNGKSGLDEAVLTIYKDLCLAASGDKDSIEYPDYSSHSSSKEENAEKFIMFVIKHPIIFVIIAILFILDLILTRGRITWFIIRMLASGARRGGGGGGRNSGGGGRSGGGGASSRF